MESIDFEEENYEQEYNLVNQYKKSLNQDDSKWIDVLISDIKISDIIYVEYLPDSQKNLFVHSPECGIVQNVENVSYTSFDGSSKPQTLINILNHNGKSICVNKDHLSIYSQGYLMIIKKLQMD